MTDVRRFLVAGGVLAGVVFCAQGHAQERQDRTLLSWTQMRAIVDETSGERAMQTVMAIAPFPRVRQAAEYEGHFYETDAMARLARDAGFSDVQIESFPLPAPLWHASDAELWMVEPDATKLSDAHDVNISIVLQSESGDVTADVVHVGIGDRPEDYANVDVKGKIVLGSAPCRILQNLGMFGHGAVGVISYQSHRPEAFPDEVLDQGHLNPDPKTGKFGFGWALAPRQARAIVDRLERGVRVRLRSVVKAASFPGKQEMVHAMIPGDGSSSQDIVISAHLFELHMKQGANDDGSGCAVTLEMGRALMRLVAEGRLPRPKRNIHFTWVDEVRGTREWLKKHDDIRKRVIADLNFDQVGNGLRASSSIYTLHRTPDTVPSYLNDLSESFLEFVAAGNRERAIYRTHGYAPSMPVLAPTGTQNDPFYIQIEKHWNPSDHRVYLDNAIPGVFFSDWPDMWYHSSYDRADKGILDATQMKRAAVVGVAAMSALASADDTMATRVALESLARGTARMGEAVRRGLGYMADATDGPSVVAAYKEARNALAHQTAVERAVVRSAAALFPDPAAGETKLAAFQPLIDARSASLQKEIDAAFRLRADPYHLATTVPAPTAAESDAARLVPERTMPAPAPDVVTAAVEKLPDADRTPVSAALLKLSDYMAIEFATLLTQKKTVLEIRDFLSAEFEPVPLADLTDYLRAQEKLGYMRFVPRPADPKATAPKIKGQE